MQDSSGLGSRPCRPPDTYAKAIAEVKQAEAAVNKVQETDLRAKKALCLEKLAEGAEGLEGFFAPSK
jgi:hypothetical protein